MATDADTLLHQHHRGDPLSEATAPAPSVVVDTIMRTIEFRTPDMEPAVGL